jgi:hypothetical protein
VKFMVSGKTCMLFCKDPHAKHVALRLAPVGGLCHRIRPPVPDAAKATVIPAKAGIQPSLILDPGFRRGDGVSDDSLPRLQEVYRQSLWTLTTCTARGFRERTEAILDAGVDPMCPVPWFDFGCRQITAAELHPDSRSASRKASTISGSNCLPLPSRITERASSCVKAFL